MSKLTDDPVVADLVMDQCMDLQTLQSCFPHESQVIPRGGRWIIVKDVPHTALPWEVPLYSIWRARRVVRMREFKVWHNKPAVAWPMTLAEITTPGGDLVLYPTEYVGTTIEKWLDLVGKGVTMHFLDPETPPTLVEPIFYLQTRGLAYRTALELLLPTVRESRFIYFTLDLQSSCTDNYPENRGPAKIEMEAKSCNCSPFIQET